MVAITRDVKNTEGGFVRVAVGAETLNRLKQLAGSSSLSGYLSGLTQELLKGEQAELLPRLKGQISLASLKLAIDNLSVRIDQLEEIISAIYVEDDRSNTQTLFGPTHISHEESTRDNAARQDIEHRAGFA